MDALRDYSTLKVNDKTPTVTIRYAGYGDDYEIAGANSALPLRFASYSLSAFAR